MADYGDILVITTARDEAAIQPYIDWKKEKGYNVEKEVVANGTNAKSLIQAKYAANANRMYVLLVGGWNEIQSKPLCSTSHTPWQTLEQVLLEGYTACLRYFCGIITF
jgi:hypothetical protein